MTKKVEEECRALIKRVDDLLHDDDAEAAHVELHELAHKFEQCVAAQRQDLTSCSNLEIAYEWERRFGPLAEPRLAQRPDPMAMIQEIIEDIRDMESENVIVAKMRVLAGITGDGK